MVLGNGNNIFTLAYKIYNTAYSILTQMVEKYPDSTLSEYCEYWLMNYVVSLHYTI